MKHKYQNERVINKSENCSNFDTSNDVVHTESHKSQYSK